MVDDRSIDQRQMTRKKICAAKSFLSGCTGTCSALLCEKQPRRDSRGQPIIIINNCQLAQTVRNSILKNYSRPMLRGATKPKSVTMRQRHIERKEIYFVQDHNQRFTCTNYQSYFSNRLLVQCHRKLNLLSLIPLGLIALVIPMHSFRNFPSSRRCPIDPRKPWLSQKLL